MLVINQGRDTIEWTRKRQAKRLIQAALWPARAQVMI